MSTRILFIAVFSTLSTIPALLIAQSKIHGSVTDINNSPIAGATVLLLRPVDSALVKGTVTNSAGIYLFENIAAGEYFINFSHASFISLRSSLFQVFSNSKNIDQGILKLEPVASTLANVTVVAARPLYEQKPDRLTINVENSITSAGNTALQILERSPGVVVNRQNNTIAMLGKDGVNVMINGKLSYMPASAILQMLDGMSAGNIDRIELITTPPSNFDAEGKAGYINIVLKQNDNAGTNGSFSATLGYGKGWATQPSLNFNHRTGNVNIYGDFSYSRVKNKPLWEGYYRISNKGNIYETYGNNDRNETSSNYNARLGLDYQISKRTVMGVLLTGNGRGFSQNEIVFNSFYKNGLLDTAAIGNNTELHNWKDYGVNLNLQQDFAKGGNLSVNAYYLHYRKNQPVNYYSRYYDKAENFVYDEAIRNGNEAPLNYWIGAMDYAQKLSKKINLEAGIKGTLADFTNTLSFARLTQGNWVKDPSLSSEYILKENYSAAYISINIAAGEKTSIKGGLRYEYSNSNLGSATEKNIVNRHYGRLFPTFFFSRKLNEKNTLTFSYSSRITRPTFNDLAPFTYYTNRYSVLTGNPALQPAISNAVTAGYTFKKYLLQVSFTNENNTITSFQPDVDSVSRKTVLKPENLNNQKTASLLLSIPVTVSPWWNVQLNITGLWIQTKALYKGESLRFVQKNIGINMTQSFILPKDYSLELTGFYQSAATSGIMVFKSFGSLNFGARKKLSVRNSFSFSVENLFNTLQWRIKTNLPEYNNVENVRLVFSWRTFKLTYTRSFGKQKLKASRSRTTGAEDEKERVQYKRG